MTLSLLATMPIAAAQNLSNNDQQTDFFHRYCGDCHGETDPKAETSLLHFPHSASTEKDWDKVVRALTKLQSGSMPPLDYPQPLPKEREAAVNQLRLKLRNELGSDSNKTLTPNSRRLSNFEYENTIQDLLGIDLHLAKHLPEDPSKPYRFNQTPDFLRMTGERLQRYQENARRALDAVIVDPTPPKIHQARREWIPEKNPRELAIEGNKRGSPADGLSIKTWPTHGTYRVRIKASGKFPEGTTDFPLRLVMGYSLASDIGAAPFTTVGTVYLKKSDDHSQVYEFFGRIENHPSEPERQYRRGGTRTGNLVTIPEAMVITPQNLFDDGTLNDRLDLATRPTAVIDWIDFESPWSETWPPPHHQRILFDSPMQNKDSASYARQVIETFLGRAFRRPVRKEEIDRYVRIHEIHHLETDNFEEAIRKTLAAALSSSNFLYHINSKDVSFQQFQIANRLSYFLWGSMPDEPLFEIATAGQLNDPKVIESQVRRMLADPKSRRFIDQLSRQWLGLDKCISIPIHTKRFPRFLHLVSRGQHAGDEVPFRPTIRDAMVEETIAYVGELIDSNQTCFSLIDSDFAMLNERLASHYGITDVRGHQIRRVQLTPKSSLGGLMTHGSILTGNSTGSVPHPVYRAVWLREAILGDEVRDPPADVPSLEENPTDKKDQTLTFAERLNLHRTKTSCRECHAWLDPWGLAFEQYDAIGRFQPMVPPMNTRIRGYDPKKDETLSDYTKYLTQISTVKVSASSTLPDGTVINSLEDLKAYLLTKKSNQVATSVVRRLLSYALGRDLNAHDYLTIESLVEKSKSNGYRLQDLIVSICQSPVFLNQAQ